MLYPDLMNFQNSLLCLRWASTPLYINHGWVRPPPELPIMGLAHPWVLHPLVKIRDLFFPFFLQIWVTLPTSEMSVYCEQLTPSESRLYVSRTTRMAVT
jgi:hypothetical protein